MNPLISNQTLILMKLILLVFIVPFLAIGCFYQNNTEEHKEFSTYFKEYEVEGCFIAFDLQKNKTIIYNEPRCKQGFLPASTFKILNSLIGLETGIITNKNFVIPWDSINRQIPAWNRNHTLVSAFQNSVVPWYQELARRIGVNSMNQFISQVEFGEMDIAEENIDLFWLVGNSRISPTEQLDFQKRLINNEIPFSEKNIALVKEIMILEETPEYTLRGKTGWAVMDNTNIGWLVGYLEKDNNKYAYVINVESDDEDTTLFRKSRMEIVRKIFKQLSLM